MNKSDFLLIFDISASYVIGRLVWLTVSELAIKPLLFHWYGHLDRALKDRLPNIK